MFRQVSIITRACSTVFAVVPATKRRQGGKLRRATFGATMYYTQRDSLTVGAGAGSTARPHRATQGFAYGTMMLPETTKVAEFSPKQAALAKLTYNRAVQYVMAPKFYEWEIARLQSLTTDPQLRDQLKAILQAPLGGQPGQAQMQAPLDDPWVLLKRQLLDQQILTISPQWQADSLDASVRRVQQSLGLPATGFVDVAMWRALGQKYIVGVSDTAKKAASQAVPTQSSGIHPLAWVFAGVMVGLSIMSLASKER